VAGAIGIYAECRGCPGVYGRSASDTGVEGSSTSGYGMLGTSTSSVGVRGTSDSNYGMLGISTSGTGVWGTSTSGYGMLGTSTSSVGVRGTSDSNDGMEGISTSGVGVLGSSTSSTGVVGDSISRDGVQGRSSASTGVGVWGINDAIGGVGVWGDGINGTGVVGRSASWDGVDGISTANGGYGVYGDNSAGYAGYFSGNVHVTGSCCSAAEGSFKIDDPLDPANKYLNQATVASPDMMDIYNGNVTTDANGEATIQLPDWFQVLNRDFRYQLTTIGQFAQAMVSSEIKDNRFGIKTDKPNVKVSWQVTGIRQDPYAKAHRIPVEEDKPASEKGKYLYPAEYGQPPSLGIDYEHQQKMRQAAERKP
jgi:hypothetical protein